ncbi:MAG: hypothetical protein IPL60_09960 [Ardenticatenia bacterium]|nr:hypothetical protein [Ardenticatenia bacterium]
MTSDPAATDPRALDPAADRAPESPRGTPALLACLALAHGLSDGSAGWLLAGLPVRQPLAAVTGMVLLYNGLAFGLQPAFGWLLDRRGKMAGALVGSLLLMAAALGLGGQPWTAVALAGLASGWFHVAAGALSLRATPRRALGPGVFAAPGVLGLALGGWAALRGVDARPLLLPALAGMAVLAWIAARRTRMDQALRQPELALTEAKSAGQANAAEDADDPAGVGPPLLDDHDLLMLLLLSAIALRSAIWTLADIAWQGRGSGLLAIALAAAVGKLAGGWLADKVGWRRWTLGAALAAVPLLVWGGRRLWTLLPGIALLQSSTPVMLAVVARRLPARPALASGLVLGLAILLGGLTARGLPADLAWPRAALPLGIGLLLLLAVGLARATPGATESDSHEIAAGSRGEADQVRCVLDPCNDC